MNIDSIPLLSERDRLALADSLAHELLSDSLRQEIDKPPATIHLLPNNYGLSPEAQKYLERARLRSIEAS